MRYAADGSPFFQYPVSCRHRVAAKAKLRGQCSLAGQTITRQEPAESDLLLDIPRQLDKEGIALCSVEAEAVGCGRHS
jgi:hypothetical protein